jgi:acyl-CoA thioesterase-1
VERLDNWLGQGPWDVIHFNFGLHDLRIDDGRNQVSLEPYEQNLRTMVARLKQTGATLIWCSTTPVPENTSPPRKPGDVIAYNAVARKVMDDNGIPIDDLYTFALPRLGEIQRPANVHFTPQGSKVLADQVAGSIRDALGRRPSSGK